MRALLAIAMVAALAGSARADEAFSEILPGVQTDASKPSIYLGVMFGKIDSELNDDNHDRGMTENSGWLYGLSFRAEHINLISRYGGRFGGAADFEMFLTTGGVISGPQQPTASYVYLGFTPSLLLGLVNTKPFKLSAEVGLPLTTDFYGMSAGGVMQIKSFYLGYRIRSGKAWRDTEVLDERIRIGVTGPGVKNTKSFFGLEIIDGYSEDDMGRANLGTMFRGSYTSVSLIVSTGR